MSPQVKKDTRSHPLRIDLGKVPRTGGQIDIMLYIVYPGVAKVEDAADARRPFD